VMLHSPGAALSDHFFKRVDGGIALQVCCNDPGQHRSCPWSEKRPAAQSSWCRNVEFSSKISVARWALKAEVPLIVSSEEACNWSIGQGVWLRPFNRISVGVEFLPKRQVVDEIPETSIGIALKVSSSLGSASRMARSRIMADYLYNRPSTILLPWEMEP
jgi:hypothetical protein